MENRRKERLREVWAQVEKLTPDRTIAEVNRKTRRMVERFFKTRPDVAEAAIRKVIWQCKRKMAGLPVGRHHCVILCGNQDTGKSIFWRWLREVIDDLSKQIDVVALVSDSQLDVYTYILIYLD